MKRREFVRVIAFAPVIALAAPTGHPRKVGIALGGGSIHGVAHLGVIKALGEKGLKFDFIAGTSAGAIVGVLVAARLPNEQIDNFVRRIEWPGVMDLSLSGKGLMRNEKLRSQIDFATGSLKIEQLPIAFGAIATELATGKRVIIRKLQAGASIEASCSIPVMFEPVKIDGRELVDGSLTEPVPVLAVREMGADIVIGVDVAFRPREDAVRGLSGVVYQTMHIMANALIEEQIRHADVAIRMNLHELVAGDGSHEKLIAAGHAAAQRAWPAIAALLSGSSSLQAN